MFRGHLAPPIHPVQFCTCANNWADTSKFSKPELAVPLKWSLPPAWHETLHLKGYTLMQHNQTTNLTLSNKTSLTKPFNVGSVIHSIHVFSYSDAKCVFVGCYHLSSKLSCQPRSIIYCVNCSLSSVIQLFTEMSALCKCIEFNCHLCIFSISLKRLQLSQ